MAACWRSHFVLDGGEMAAIPASLVTGSTPAAARQTSAEYDLIDLGSVQGSATDPARLLMPKAIDEAGRVLGNRVDLDGAEAPMLAGRAGRNELPSADRSLRATSVRSGGRIVGRATGGFAGVWADGAWNELALPELLHEECQASFTGAADDSGRIAGWMSMREGGALPLLWEAGSVRILPPVGDLTHAWPVSLLDDGSIAGEARGCDGGHYPIVWRDGNATLLPSPKNWGRVRSGVSCRSAHLGSAWSGARFEAAIWVDGDCELLPALTGDALESAVYGLSATNTAVGITWRTPARSTWIATRWQAGRASDLNDLIAPEHDIWLISANAINNAGQIAAAAIWPDRSLHAVRLDPR